MPRTKYKEVESWGLQLSRRGDLARDNAMWSERTTYEISWSVVGLSQFYVGSKWKRRTRRIPKLPLWLTGDNVISFPEKNPRGGAVLKKKENVYGFGSLEFKEITGHLRRTLGSRSEDEEGGGNWRYRPWSDQHRDAQGEDKRNQFRGQQCIRSGQEQCKWQRGRRRASWWHDAKAVTNFKTKGVTNTARCCRKFKKQSPQDKRNRRSLRTLACVEAKTLEQSNAVSQLLKCGFVMEGQQTDTCTRTQWVHRVRSIQKYVWAHQQKY